MQYILVGQAMWNTRKHRMPMFVRHFDFVKLQFTPFSPQRFLVLCRPVDDLPLDQKCPPALVSNGTTLHTELKPLSQTKANELTQ